MTTTVYPNYTFSGVGRGEHPVFYAIGRDQTAALDVRLLEHSQNMPLEDCQYRVTLTQTSHTPIVGKQYRCFEKLSRLQYTPGLGLGLGLRVRVKG